MAPDEDSPATGDTSPVDEHATPLAPDRLLGALSRDLDRLASSVSVLRDLSALETRSLLRAAPERVSAVRHQIEERAERTRHELEEASIAALRSGIQRLEDLVPLRREEATRPLEGGYVVAGRVVDADTGEPVPSLLVEALERDPAGEADDERLGTTETDELGFYRIEYTAEDFHADADEAPETYVRVLAREGAEPLFVSDRSFRHQADQVEEIDAAVSGEEVPENLAAGAKTMRTLDRERQILPATVRAREAAQTVRTDVERLWSTEAE